METIMPTPDVANDANEDAVPTSQASSDAVASPGRPTRRRGAGRLLDLKEAESYSGISAWTLRELIASGDLPAVRPPRLRRVWIDRTDLDKAIAQWKDR
jgi:excisionase family DNA binding protein